MVPNGWKLSNFKDLNIVTVDGDRGKNYPKKEEYLSDGYSLFLGADNIKEGVINLDSKTFLSKERHDALNKGVVAYDDLLLVMRGNGTGRTALYSKEASAYKIARINSGLVIIRIDQSKLDKYFALQLMQSRVIIKQFESYMFGSAQPQLTIKILKSLVLPNPPLKEQQKIAKILSTWDKAISTTENLIENSTQQKKALMQQLLTGKKRLLDDEGKRFEGEWQNIRLGDLTSKITKGTTPSSNGYQFQEKGINFVKIESITRDGKFIPSKFAHISDECHESFKRSQLKKNDILFSIAGALGRVAMVTEEILPSNTNQALAVIRLKPNIIDLSLLFFFLNSPQIAKKIMIMSVQAAQANLSLKDIGNLPISKPSLEEQQKIAAILTNADKEIELLEQQLADLQQEKKALMQVLLTGKKRVVVDS